MMIGMIELIAFSGCWAQFVCAFWLISAAESTDCEQGVDGNLFLFDDIP